VHVREVGATARAGRARLARPALLTQDSRPRSLAAGADGTPETHLDLQNAFTSVIRPAAAKPVLIGSVPPLMLKTEANPGGLPEEVFDGLQAQAAAHRSQFYRDFAAGPFYGYNRPGAQPSEAIIEKWWRQGMMGGAEPRTPLVPSAA
jgi:hypothetical protein